MIVGHTLVDASSRTASVLMVNPNAEEVVLPSFTCVGKLVPMSAISVALADPGLPNEEHATLPEHLEEIIAGSHPSLGDFGRQLLCDLLYRYRHVFPAPGDPVTGRTTSVQHEIHEALVCIGSCLWKNVHCRWILDCHDRIRSHRMRFLAHLLGNINI